MKQPELEFAFEIKVDVAGAGILEAGDAGKGIRRAIPIMSGTFEGSNIKGAIVRGGYDWQLIRNDGVIEIDARYLLQTDDGSLITIVNKGLRHGPPEVMKRLAMGEEVNPDEYYFRSIPVFETGNPRYNWLIKNIFIATGIRKPSQVLISVWKVM